MNIEKARYEYAIKRAYDFLIDEDICSFPIDPIDVINKRGWNIYTYQEIAKLQGCTVDHIITTSGSSDGFVSKDNNDIYIAYNNDWSKTKERIRFTLMHEIGHLYLGHVKYGIFDNLNHANYKELEKEANCFARNVLAPLLFIEYLERDFFNDPLPSILNNIFGLSTSAVQFRIKMLNNDMKYYKKLDIDHVYFMDLMLYLFFEKNVELNGKFIILNSHYIDLLNDGLLG